MDQSRGLPTIPSTFAQRQLRGQQVGEVTLLSVGKMLRKRRWIVISAMLVGLAAGVLLSLAPRQYTASGSLRVHPGSSSMYNVNAEKLLTGGDADERIESEVNILHSKSMLLDVAKELDLVHNPAFLGEKYDAHASLDDPEVRSDTLKAMRKMVKIERVPKTEVINISCTSASPMTSTKVVNALANSYIERLFRNSYSSTQRASQWLTGQISDLKLSVEKDQEQLVELQGKLGVVGFDDTHNLVTSQLEALAKASAESSLQRIIAEARYRILESSSPDLVEGGPALLASGTQMNSSNGSLIQSLRNTRAQLSSRYAELNAQFGPNYPDVKQTQAELQETDKQVKAEEDRILNQAKIAFSAAKHNEDMTEAALSHEKEDALKKSDDMVRYEILLHEYQVNRKLYEGLTERLREAGIMSGLASNEVDIVDMADVPSQPSGATRWETILLSGCFGFFGGVILSYVVEGVDTSISSMDELVALTDVPALAVLPKVDERRKLARGGQTLQTTERRPTLTNQEVVYAPNSPFSEGIRSLRTALMLSRAVRPPKVILFTSAIPGEGKSTVSANTACLLAQYDARVLLIDADLRLPTQHVRFRVSNATGLTSVLTGNAHLEDATQKVAGVANLQILTSGPLTSAAGMLVGSEQMRRLVNRCADQFDYVLLDSPPCATMSDAVMLSSMSEATILIVRERSSKRSVIRRVVDKLEASGTSVTGFVLNGVDQRSSEYYAYYGDYGKYASAGLPTSSQKANGTHYEN
ncbi:GumC family protein [Silvibacterium acidisoli]|uniref:GumC family protein n=1 Tax=Acidobacteriaceae bacterium ZG23-2 TaxID=2883246 RepID=UPI00406CE36A